MYPMLERQFEQASLRTGLPARCRFILPCDRRRSAATTLKKPGPDGQSGSAVFGGDLGSEAVYDHGCGVPRCWV